MEHESPLNVNAFPSCMGLAVVHGIVASHDGEISVASTPGVGSSFTVLFPEVPFGAGELR